MTSYIFQETWDYIYSLGTKCNTHAIRRKLGIPGFSSPFDNMDSVAGMRDCARVLTVGAQVYYGDQGKWVLRNDYGARSTVVRSKVLYNSDYPGLYYPHFHPGWFEKPVSEELDHWIRDPSSSIDTVWGGFSSTFARRLERLTNFLQDGKKILFLRVDEKNSLPRIYAQGNTVQDLAYSTALLQQSGFEDFQILYLYARNSQYWRDIPSGTHWQAIGIDADGLYDEDVSSYLTALQFGKIEARVS